MACRPPEAVSPPHRPSRGLRRALWLEQERAEGRQNRTVFSTQAEVGGRHELEAAIAREARAAHEEAAVTARLAREGEERARWEAELQERITRTLQVTVQEQLQALKAEEPPPPAGGEQAVALNALEREYEEDVSRLRTQHEDEMGALHSELQAHVAR